ncbi:hypothetical protein GQ54DRAFT_27093 [Martensiomyces pterosporus]|nr:hypothetical protein GQ54DRAFT_27093 [Martensiomyces pterosporus]
MPAPVCREQGQEKDKRFQMQQVHAAVASDIQRPPSKFSMRYRKAIIQEGFQYLAMQISKCE